MLDVAPLQSLANKIIVERLPQSWRDTNLDRAELSQQTGVAVMIGLAEFVLQFSFDLRDFFRQAVSQEQVMTQSAFGYYRQKSLKASRSSEFFQANAHKVFIQLLSDQIADGIASAGELKAGRVHVETGDARTITQAITRKAAFLR